MERLLAKKWQINENIDVDLKTKQYPVKQNKIPTSIIEHCSSITAVDDGIKNCIKLATCTTI